MLSRLGFAGRISSILLLALLALWALGAGLSYVTRTPLVPTPSPFPLPHQIAAIVELLEKGDTEQRKILLRAVNTDTLQVTLSDMAPEAAPGQRRLVGIEWLVGRYVNALGPRELIATTASGNIAGPLPDSPIERVSGSIRIGVALKGGGYVIFQPRGEITRRLFGVPPGYWLGFLGALVGIAALFAVWREAQPLKELSRAVSHFSGDGNPMLVTPRGAPELKRLIDETNRMQERIATLLKGRTILLGAVSHDLKTYITRLKLRAEMISDPDQQARAGRDLDDMTVLIEDALAMSRGASVQDRTSLVDLTELLHTLCADHPNIERLLPDTSLILKGSPVGLRRLFSNLIDNALHYGGKTVTVSAASMGTRVRATVEDDGPGIPPAERALVFEPFYRREPSRSRETGGSGLGLAIAKQIVELHGGAIILGESSSGGLRVVVELPSAVE